jgi:hypothetical protein
MTNKMFIKYNLLEIFQKLLKKIPIEFWLSQRQAQGLEVLAVQVDSIDLAVLPELHLYSVFGGAKESKQQELHGRTHKLPDLLRE